MIKDLKFLSDEELNNLINNNPDRAVILWGVGFVSDAIIETLIAKGITINYFGDSNTSLVGKEKARIRIISIDDMQKHLDDIVIISSYGYLPIYRMLKTNSVKNIYALLDVYKYPLSDMKADKLYLEEIPYIYESGRILLELYGNIGDVIIRIGIVQKFIKEFGKERVFLLFNNESHAELYRLITNNIICITGSDLLDRRRRQKLLSKLKELSFEKSFILCDVRLIALHRMLNKYNSNIGEVIFTKEVPEDEYLPGIDAEMVCRYFGWDNPKQLTGWNKLGDKIVKLDYVGQKYVAINLGASKKTRRYQPEAFEPVVEYLLAKGYKVFLVGEGNYDQMVARKLALKYGEDLSDFTSKLTIREAATIIRGADLFIGTDSAMSHVAYILGIPSVVIMGGGEYESFMHPDGKVKYVTVKDRSCFGCKWYCDKTDEYGRARCVYNITSKEIIEGIIELVEER